MVDFLRAIPNYWQGYTAAFRYDAPPALHRLNVPALLTALPTDPVGSHLKRIGEMPAKVKVSALPNSSDPQGALVERIVGFLAGDPLADAGAPPPVIPALGAVRRDYVDTSVGQLLMRRTGGGTGRPLVLFHASPGSSLGLEPLLLALGADRPAITFDTPGNGDSAPPRGPVEIRDLAKILGEAIDALGLKDYDLYGTHTGALVAMEVAIARSQQVRHLILDGVTMFSDSETQDLLANYPLPLQISSDGGYLIWAWNFQRDGSLWWPWYNRTASGARIGVRPLSPETQHRNFVEFIKGGATYHFNYRAAFAYPTRTRLPLIKTPTLLCASSSDVLLPGLAEAAQLAQHAQVRVTAGSTSSEAMKATVYLYRRFLADQTLPDGPTR
jgi:pimeloyl-ACP methyl ester carboxylesterase